MVVAETGTEPACVIVALDQQARTFKPLVQADPRLQERNQPDLLGIKQITILQAPLG